MDLLDGTVELYFSQYLINTEIDFRIVMLTQALRFDYDLVEIYKEKNITEGKRYTRHTQGLQLFLKFLSERLEELDVLKKGDGYHSSLTLIKTAGDWEHVYKLADSENEELSEKAEEVLAKFHSKVTEEIKQLEEDG